MKIILLTAVLTVCFLSGCGREEAKNHPLYLRGMQLRDEGDAVSAERYFKRYLERFPRSARAHLALATLYDEALGNPAAALFYYDEYLMMTPEDSSDRNTIENYRQLVRAKLLRQLADEPLPDLPAAVLAAENRQLRQVNDQLKRHIYTLQQREREKPVAAPPPEAPGRREQRFHTVERGDTPGSIARRYYGSASKYTLIMEANSLSGSGNLRIGQKLVIPYE